MNTQEFTKERIHFDENKYERDFEGYEKRLPYYQMVVDKYNELGIAQKLLPDDLLAILEQPKKVLAQKIMNGQELQVGGLKIKDENLFDMVEKPEKYEAFLSWIINTTTGPDQKEKNVWPAKSYQVDDAGNTATVKPEVSELLEGYASIFIETPAQKEAHEIGIEIVKKLNELKALKGGLLPDNFLFNHVVATKGDLNHRNDYTVDPRMVKQF